MTAFLALIFLLLVSFTGSLMESASLQSAKSYRRADVNRAIESVFAEYQKELLEEFDIFALDGSYETGTYGEQKVLDRMAYYGASGIDSRIERIQLLCDDGGAAFLDQAARCMESRYGISGLGGLGDGLELWEGKEEEAMQYQETGQQLSEQLSGMLSESGTELPAENNPLPNMQGLASAPLAELVMPKEKALSEKSVDADSLVSRRNRNRGYGDFSDVAETKEPSKILFGEYILEHFETAVREEDEIMAGPLDYEAEYILMGKDSDRENLEGVLKRLLLLRFAPNYAYLRQDGAKQAEAQALALVLSTAAAAPEAADALAQVLLVVWAFGESIMDLRSLMQGGRVPLTKSAESWQLSLSGLMTLGTEEDRKEGADIDGGLKYREYLRVLFFLDGKQEMAMRTLDMIELCLRQEKGLGWFRADQCISRMEISSTVNLRRGITYRFQTYYGYR